MKKTIRKALCGILAVATVGSVGLMTACETNNPEVQMKVEFNGATYTLEYKLYRKITPQTVNHFLTLVSNGYYNGLCFHDFDADAGKMYTGGYKWEDNDLVEINYFEKVSAYASFPYSVWRDNDKKDPLYTLAGEFADNNFYVGSVNSTTGKRGNENALTQTFGALTMYYTPKKTDQEVVVARLSDSKSIEKDYKYNSATSLFSISISEEEKVDEAYCTFATLRSDFTDDLQALLDAIDEEKAYKISATASSMATIPRTVVVKGPRVLFSRRTSVVAAGAVADEIEPNINPIEIDVFISLVNRKETAVTTMETTKNGTIASKNKMPVNCFPYFFRTEIFSSPPIKNPIRARAIELTGSKAEITFALRT